MTFADCRPHTTGCRMHDCKLKETKNIAMKVASLSTLPCSKLLTKWEVRPRREVYIFHANYINLIPKGAVGCTPRGSIKSPWRMAKSILEMKPDECNFVQKISTLFPGYFLTFLEAWKRCYIFDDVTFIRRFLVSFNLQSAVCSLHSAVWLQTAVCRLRSAVCKSQRDSVDCIAFK